MPTLPFHQMSLRLEFCTLCSDLKVVIGHASSQLSSVTTPTWSPSREHLIYQKVSFSKLVEALADVDVFLAAADGGVPVNVAEGPPEHDSQDCT